MLTPELIEANVFATLPDKRIAAVVNPNSDAIEFETASQHSEEGRIDVLIFPQGLLRSKYIQAPVSYRFKFVFSQIPNGFMETLEGDVIVFTMSFAVGAKMLNRLNSQGMDIGVWEA